MTESPAGHNRDGAVASVAGRLLVDGNLIRGAVVVDGGRIVDVRIGDARNVGPVARRRGSTPTSSRRASSICRSTAPSAWRSGGDPIALRALAARLPSTGVTTFLPTAGQRDAAAYRAAARRLSHAARDDARARACPACTWKGRCCRPRGRARTRRRHRRRGRDAGRRAGRAARRGRRPAGDAGARAPGRARAHRRLRRRASSSASATRTRPSSRRSRRSTRARRW